MHTYIYSNNTLLFAHTYIIHTTIHYNMPIAVVINVFIHSSCYLYIILSHNFIFHPQHSKQPWRPVVRSSTPSIPPSDSPALPPALITSLQSRSLTENDYEVLLQLDIPSNSSPGSPRNSQMSGRHLIGVPERVINSFHVEPLDGTHPLIVGQATCQICGGEYLRGDWIKKLPCKHKVVVSWTILQPSGLCCVQISYLLLVLVVFKCCLHECSIIKGKLTP